ncbi:MAG: hypothetical protein ACK4VO_12535 [Pseudobdellovibrio sp.]
MMLNLRFLYLVVIIINFCSLVLSAAPNNNSSTNTKSTTNSVPTAEILGAKSFLEDILVKRYSQSLSTVVDKQAFSLSSQLDLTDLSDSELANREAESDTPFDLILGNLDSEKLIKQYGMEDQKSAMLTILSTKKIKSVLISVGLREDLGEQTKKDVEKWLSDRAKSEFGSLVKTEVSFVKELPIKREKGKEWFDWLNQFQNLVGIALMAMTFFLAVLIWRFTTGKASVTNHKEGGSESQQIKLTTEGKGLGAGGADSVTASAIALKNDEERRQIEEQIQFTQKINSITPKLASEMESIVRAWCNAGEEGKYKLVCFAESVGKELGKLPIPTEFISDIAKIFMGMSKVPVSDKRNYLEKVYWDLVTVLNLGASALEQPFSYLSNADSSLVSQILLDKNPKMKTLVSLYLPDTLRKKFISPLSSDEKLQILENAFSLKEIPSDELNDMSKDIKGQLSGDINSNNVQLEMSYQKILSTMSIIDEMEMLPKVKSQEIAEFKRKVASIAFLHEWPDDKLSIAIQKLRTDQLVAYLRFKPELKDRIISLCLPMTAEVLTDDLNQPDNMSRTEKEALLSDIAKTLNAIVSQKEIDLSEVFINNTTTSESENVVKFKTA